MIAEKNEGTKHFLNEWLNSTIFRKKIIEALYILWKERCSWFISSSQEYLSLILKAAWVPFSPARTPGKETCRKGWQN